MQPQDPYPDRSTHSPPAGPRSHVWRGSESASALTPQVRDLIRDVEEATGAPVTLLDTGPRLDDVIALT